MDETDPKGVREYGHFKTHHTYCPVAFMRGVFPFTLPMEYGFQLLIFFMTTGLDFKGVRGVRGRGRGQSTFFTGPQFPQLREWRGQVKCVFLVSLINLGLKESGLLF